MAYERILFISKPPKLNKILFSAKEEWDIIIGNSFRGQGYNIDFSVFKSEDLKNYNLVVPLTIPDLRFCIENRNVLQDQKLPIPNIESLDLCNDKQLFNAFMVEHQFDQFIPNTKSPFSFPYLLKKRVDEYGVNAYIVRNRKDESNLYEYINDPEYFCQEIIPGRHEYATHIVFQEGRIIAHVNIRYTFFEKMYIKGKDQYISKEVCFSPFNDQFAIILAAMNFEGLCCFNYKIKDGKPMIFEINPRFGGSLTDYFYSFLRKLSK